MPVKPTIEIQTVPGRNLARIRYFGRITGGEMKTAVARIESLLSELKPGFTVLTDLSGLESMDLDCVPHLTKIMDASRARGIGTVVRVVPDPDKDIGFNILSIIHYRRGVQIITCETLAEAERALGPAQE